MNKYKLSVAIGVTVMLLVLTALPGCVSTAEYEAITEQVATLEDQAAVLEDQIATLEEEKASLEADNAELQADLDALNQVYPPRYFSSATELQDWLAEDDISQRSSADAVVWYANGLKLQRRALEDGYIINAYILESPDNPGYYNVYCDAVMEDDSLYWWDPETDDIYYWLDVKHF